MSHESKIFYYALATSFLIHINVLVLLLCSSTFFLKKSLRSIQITYLSMREAPSKMKVSPSTPPKSIKEKKLAPPADIFSKREVASSPLVQEMTKTGDKLEIYKKERAKMRLVDVKREVSVPVLKSEKITNPKYLSYTEKIRGKIRERAYAYINASEFQEGEVYLTFVLLSNGILKDVKIIDEKTSANSYLRDAGLKSVTESSPFSSFPEDLNYPELTFNVVISFEIKGN